MLAVWIHLVCFGFFSSTQILASRHSCSSGFLKKMIKKRSLVKPQRAAAVVFGRGSEMNRNLIMLALWGILKWSNNMTCSRHVIPSFKGFQKHIFISLRSHYIRWSFVCPLISVPHFPQCREVFNSSFLMLIKACFMKCVAAISSTTRCTSFEFECLNLLVLSGSPLLFLSRLLCDLCATNTKRLFVSVFLRTDLLRCGSSFIWFFFLYFTLPLWVRLVFFMTW